ncbi:MAG: ligand-binding sensor domain-containing protein, partial [Chitinophagaceae bacterium]
MIFRSGHTLLIIIIIITSIDLTAQSFNPKYNFRHLNVQNGLTQNIVYHFLHDSRGYMWVGTHNGLSLFDGSRTINFLHNEQDTTSAGGKFITCILEDASQQIWIGNENGIDLYDRSTNTFKHFRVDRPDGTKDKTYCVPLGFVSVNDLWFLDTKTKAIRSLNIKTKSTTFISGLNANNALFYKSSVTQDVHIWSSYDKGTIHQVYRDTQLISEQTFFAGKNKSPVNTELEVIHVLQQNDTTVWLSTNKGLVKLNPVLNNYRIFNSWQNQTVRELRYTAFSNKGQLWAATGPDGIYVFDVNTNQFIDNFKNDKSDPFSVCSDNIVSLYFDKTNNIWCGSYGKGVSYANLGNTLFTTHISQKQTQAWNGNNHIQWLGLDPAENIWCMFENIPGFLILNKQLKIIKYRNPVFENGSIFNQAMYKLLFETGNEVWCATNKGLYSYNVNTNKLHPVKYELINEEIQGSAWIWDIIRLNDSSIIFSTFGGIYRVTKESGKPVVKPVTFLNPGAYNGFGSLFQDKKGLIYVESLGDSLYILKPTSEGKEYDLIKRMAFIPEINHFFNDKGDTIIYLATNEGLYHINNNNFRIEKEAVNKNLPFLNISSVFKKDNTLWIFGEKGLYFFDEKNKTGRTYTVEDGLPANEFSLSAL